MPIPPVALELLAALSRVISRWGRWYVFGAQAVIAYGVPRLSADVDVTLRLEPDDPQGFVADMKTAGFVLRVEDPEFIRRTRVMPFIHSATAMPLDVVLAGSGLEDEFLERARTLDIGGISVPVIDIQDLIVAKILASRPQDLTDARNLWRIHSHDLDGQSIRETLCLLEEALTQSDLLPVFDSISRDASVDP